MFTVKWIADNGAQTIYHAREVNYSPADDTPAAVESLTAACVTFYTTGQQSFVPGDSHVTLNSGRVYVMNDAGKTVADYVLKTKEFPHGLAPRLAA